MEALQRLKNYKLIESGETVDDYLNRKHRNGDRHGWKVEGNSITFSVTEWGANINYKWVVEDNNIYSVNGHAIKISPELNKNSIEIERRRREEVSKENLGIYDYVKHRYMELDNPIEEVIKDASLRFNLPEKQIEDIFLEVDHKIYLNLPKPLL